MDPLSDCHVHPWVCGSYSFTEKVVGVRFSGDGTLKPISCESL